MQLLSSLISILDSLQLVEIESDLLPSNITDSNNSLRCPCYRRHSLRGRPIAKSRKLNPYYFPLTLPITIIITYPNLLSIKNIHHDLLRNHKTNASCFPLTSPIPILITHPDLPSTKDIRHEDDLLRNHENSSILLPSNITDSNNSPRSPFYRRYSPRGRPTAESRKLVRPTSF